MPPVLTCHDLTIAVHDCVLVNALHLSLQPGTITAVLGRNGVGKSLTLQTLAGLRPARSGHVTLHNQPLTSLPKRAIAQQLGYVAQEHEEPFPVTVLECAVAGRHPHLDFWSWEAAEDYQLASHALVQVDLEGHEHRQVATLSGGERRRLALAVALTQAPTIYILDEPINHLDPHHQLQILQLMRKLADAGATVLLSLHDPTLALRFADQALLLSGAGDWQLGTVADTLTPESLAKLYRTQFVMLDHPAVGRCFAAC